MSKRKRGANKSSSGRFKSGERSQMTGSSVGARPLANTLSTPSSAMPVAYGKQLTGGHRLLCAFDLNQLKFTESRRTLNKSRRGLTEHHPIRRCHRFHPLRHTDLLTDGGVTERPRADFARDHLARVQPHTQPQVDAVAVFDLSGESGGLTLNAQSCQTGANGVVFQSHWRAEHRHDPVAGELVDCAAVPRYDRSAAVGEVGHDLSQPLCPDGKGDVHRMNNIGEQYRHLLVLRRCSGCHDRRAALVAEP